MNQPAIKTRGFKQGKYKLRHPEKYKGNPNNVRFLSSWELRAFEFFDNNPFVLEWSSQEIIIPYIKPTDNKVHKYYPDIWVKFKDNTGKIHEEIIEIKPKQQTKQPRKNSKYYLTEQITLAINVAKWKARERYCKQRNINFRIVTEEGIFK